MSTNPQRYTCIVDHFISQNLTSVLTVATVLTNAVGKKHQTQQTYKKVNISKQRFIATDWRSFLLFF